MVLKNSFSRQGRKNQAADNLLQNMDGGGGCPSSSNLSFAMLQASQSAPEVKIISWRSNGTSYQLQVSYQGELAMWKLYSLDQDPPLLNWTVSSNDPVQIYRLLLRRVAPGDAVMPESAETSSFPLPVVGNMFLNRYQITNRLAKGGMGQIFQATDLKGNNRTVAIKVLHMYLADDGAAKVRFEREMKSCINLRHPNIVSVFDYGYTQDGTPYMVMEFLKGRTLEEMLRSHGPIPINRFAHFFRQVTDALRSAHENQIIHRDIKPPNIMLLEQVTDSWLVKLLDFGIAKNLETCSPATQTGEVVGTPYYMSPEQVQNEPTDARTDIYSLGCVMYEALCGRRPIQGDTPANTMMMHILKQPDPPTLFRPEIPKELEDLVLKAMAKNPDNRFRSSHDLLAALLEFEVKTFDLRK